MKVPNQRMESLSGFDDSDGVIQHSLPQGCSAQLGVLESGVVIPLGFFLRNCGPGPHDSLEIWILWVFHL